MTTISSSPAEANRNAAETLSPLLSAAQQELAEVGDEAREEGYPEPSALAFENACRLLPAMYAILPGQFAVYPMPDGEIAIHAPGGYERSVILLCESDGGALCLVNLGVEHRRARYSTTRTLPDGFVREALAEMPAQPAI